MINRIFIIGDSFCDGVFHPKQEPNSNIGIKEEEAQRCKDELLILWTDYFKPQHLESYPDLHEIFWNAAKLCSSCKVEVSVQHCGELMEAIEKIHNIFWSTKNREVAWYTAG
mgnify:CR=1 FL=1